MQVILKEDIIGLGYKNDIVTVREGYGRNYLIPQEKAVIASESAKKQLAETLKQQARKIEAMKAKAQEKADALNGVEVVVKMKVSANGVTYGSVNAGVVAKELQEKGFDIDRKIITMRDVKKLGDFEATIHFFKGVEVIVPVKVEAEEAPAKAEENNEEQVAEAAEEKVAQAGEVEAPAEEVAAEEVAAEEAPEAE